MIISDTIAEQIESSKEIWKGERRKKDGRKRKEENGRMRDKQIEERDGRMLGMKASWKRKQVNIYVNK